MVPKGYVLITDHLMMVRLQKIPDILDAHSDIGKLHLQRHALLHSRIYGLETIPTFLLITFTLNTISTRDFCNMLHFSLLNLPRSAKLAAKT